MSCGGALCAEMARKAHWRTYVPGVRCHAAPCARGGPPHNTVLAHCGLLAAILQCAVLVALLQSGAARALRVDAALRGRSAATHSLGTTRPCTTLYSSLRTVMTSQVPLWACSVHVSRITHKWQFAALRRELKKA